MTSWLLRYKLIRCLGRRVQCAVFPLMLSTNRALDRFCLPDRGVWAKNGGNFQKTPNRVEHLSTDTFSPAQYDPWRVVTKFGNDVCCKIVLRQQFRFSIDLILVRDWTLYTLSRSTPYIEIPVFGLTRKKITKDGAREKEVIASANFTTWVGFVW